MKNKSMVLARRSASGSTALQRFTNDDYRQVFGELRKKKAELEGLNRKIVRALDVKLQPLPKIALAVSEKLPFLRRMVDNRFADPLSAIESELRGFINLTQESLIALQEIAQSKRDEIMELRADLERAATERWSVQQLRDYIIEKSGIELDPRVAELMNFESDVISPEQYQQKQKDLLETLAASAATGEDLLKMLVTVVFNSLGIFEGAISQYYAFVNIAEPMKVIKEAAENLTSGTEAMYTAKAAVISILKASVEAIDTATRAAQLAENYRLNSSDVTLALAEANAQLQRTINLHPALPASSNTKLLAIKPLEADVIEMKEA